MNLVDVATFSSVLSDPVQGCDFNDLTVNALRGKQLTNFRAAGKDHDEGLVPPIKFSLEQALEFIDDDELVEITPKAIRLLKKACTENERKRASRAA